MKIKLPRTIKYYVLNCAPCTVDAVERYIEAYREELNLYFEKTDDMFEAYLVFRDDAEQTSYDLNKNTNSYPDGVEVLANAFIDIPQATTPSGGILNGTEVFGHFNDAIFSKILAEILGPLPFTIDTPLNPKAVKKVKEPIEDSMLKKDVLKQEELEAKIEVGAIDAEIFHSVQAVWEKHPNGQWIRGRLKTVGHDEIIFRRKKNNWPLHILKNNILKIFGKPQLVGKHIEINGVEVGPVKGPVGSQHPFMHIEMTAGQAKDIQTTDQELPPEISNLLEAEDTSPIMEAPDTSMLAKLPPYDESARSGGFDRDYPVSYLNRNGQFEWDGNENRILSDLYHRSKERIGNIDEWRRMIEGNAKNIPVVEQLTARIKEAEKKERTCPEAIRRIEEQKARKKWPLILWLAKHFGDRRAIPILTAFKNGHVNVIDVADGDLLAAVKWRYMLDA